MNDAFDICVVGAGPAGIAAAVTAAEAGRRVALVDENPFAGGQIWRHQGEGSKVTGAAAWMRRLASAMSVEHLQQTRVVAKPGPNELLVETNDRARTIAYRSLILATGARELFLPLPGWTLPGVFGVGAIQALVKTGLPVRGKRIVVAGTGPLLLAVADLLRAKGAIVPLVIEQATAGALGRFAMSLVATPSKLLQGAAIRARLVKTTFATNAYATAVTPAVRGLRVEYLRRGMRATIDCDYFACGYHLIPNLEFPQLLGCAVEDGVVRVDDHLRTSVPSVFAVGELTGVGGVEKAIFEGRMAALVAIGEESAVSQLASARARALAFTRRLDAAFALRPELLKLAKPDTIICRCEDVPMSAVARSIDSRDAKLQTRCGMGPCQGRMCGPALERVFGMKAGHVRPPVQPVRVSTLAHAQE
ncbi:MAG: FAD/NAD(P)-binding oxidoreductase [Tepidisphaeraceae bacterium]